MDWVVPVALGTPANGDFSSTSMAADEDGNVLVIGIEGEPYYYGSRVFGDLGSRLYGPDGEVLMNGTFTGRGAVVAVVSQGGSFFVLGQFKDSLLITGHPQLTVTGEPNNVGSFVCRIEPDGSVPWMKDLDALGALGDASSLAVNAGGTLFISAWDFIDSVVLLVDAEGDLITEWTMAGVGLISDVSANADGMVAIAGSCLSNTVDLNGTVLTTPNDYTIFVARFSPNGVLQDHLIITDITCPFPDVELDEQGGLYCSADAFIDVAVGPFMVHDPEWVFGNFLFRMDEQGEVEWLDQPVSGPTVGDVARGSGRDLLIHPAGGVWQCGSMRGSIDWGDDVSTAAPIPGNSLYVWHVNGDGSTVGVVTGDAPNFAQSAICLATGGDALYVLGTGYDTLRLGGGELPAQGHHLHLSRWSAIAYAIAEERPDHRPTLRPNPATDRIEVVPSALYGTVRGELIDPQGRTIKTFTSVGNATLDLGGIPSGVYQVRLVQDGTVQHGRFVKQ